MRPRLTLTLPQMVAELIETAIAAAEAHEASRQKAARRSCGPKALMPSVVVRDVGYPTAVLTAPDRQHVFVGNGEGQLLVLHAESGSVVARADVHSACVTAMAVAYNRAGVVLLASSSATMLCVYDVSFERSELSLLCSGEPPAMGPGGGARALTLSPEGDALLACGWDGSITVYAVTQSSAGAEVGEMVPLLIVTAADARALLQISAPMPESPALAVACAHFQTWRTARPPTAIATGGALMASARDGGGDSGTRAMWQVRGLYAAWPGQNKVLLLPLAPPPVPSPALAAADGLVADPPAPRPRLIGEWKLPHAVTCIAQSLNGSRQAWGLSSGAVILWDPRLLTERGVIAPRADAWGDGTGGGVTAAIFLGGDGARLVVGHASGEVVQYDLGGGAVAAIGPAPPAAISNESDALAAPPLALFCPRFGRGALVLRAGLRVQAYDPRSRLTGLEVALPTSNIPAEFAEVGAPPPAWIVPALSMEPSVISIASEKSKPDPPAKGAKGDSKASAKAAEVPPPPPPPPKALPPPNRPRGSISGLVVCDYASGLLAVSIVPQAATDPPPLVGEVSVPLLASVCGIALYDVDLEEVEKDTPKTRSAVAETAAIDRTAAGGQSSGTKAPTGRLPLVAERPSSAFERRKRYAESLGTASVQAAEEHAHRNRAAIIIQAAQRSRSARYERARLFAEKGAAPLVPRPTTEADDLEDEIVDVARRVLWLRGGHGPRLRRMQFRGAAMLAQLLQADNANGVRPALVST